MMFSAHARNYEELEKKILHVFPCSILSYFDTRVMVTPMIRSRKCLLYFHTKILYTEFVIIQKK